MNRFFVEPELLAAGPDIVLKDELAHQLTNVLRLGPGERITLLDNRGWEYSVELAGSRRQGKTTTVQARVTGRQAAGGEPRLQITLYQALLKGEKMDYVLQKATEIGVARFVPILTERCVGQAARTERWQKIIREAAEQSRRGHRPELAPQARRLAEALTEIKAAGYPAYMAWEEERVAGLRGIDRATGHLAFIIGPEGGFAPAEAEQAHQAGVITVSLGPRILRAETAGPVMAALALFQTGDMEP